MSLHYVNQALLCLFSGNDSLIWDWTTSARHYRVSVSSLDALCDRRLWKHLMNEDSRYWSDRPSVLDSLNVASRSHGWFPQVHFEAHQLQRSVADHVCEKVVNFELEGKIGLESRFFFSQKHASSSWCSQAHWLFSCPFMIGLSYLKIYQTSIGLTFH